MIGKVVMNVSQATMMEALQHYFDTKVFKGPTHKVMKVYEQKPTVRVGGYAQQTPDAPEFQIELEGNADVSGSV